MTRKQMSMVDFVKAYTPMAKAGKTAAEIAASMDKTVNYVTTTAANARKQYGETLVPKLVAGRTKVNHEDAKNELMAFLSGLDTPSNDIPDAGDDEGSQGEGESDPSDSVDSDEEIV